MGSLRRIRLCLFKKREAGCRRRPSFVFNCGNYKNLSLIHEIDWISSSMVLWCFADILGFFMMNILVIVLTIGTYWLYLLRINIVMLGFFIWEFAPKRYPRTEDILVSPRIPEDIRSLGEPRRTFSDIQGDLLGYPRRSLWISYSISVDLHDISMTSPWHLHLLLHGSPSTSPCYLYLLIPRSTVSNPAG